MRAASRPSGRSSPCLPGPAAEAVPVTEVGPLGVSDAGGLADLIASGEGRAGGWNGLRQQDWGLHKRWITVIIRYLRRKLRNSGRLKRVTEGVV